MYINPFIFGVMCTLFVEMAGYIFTVALPHRKRYYNKRMNYHKEDM